MFAVIVLFHEVETLAEQFFSLGLRNWTNPVFLSSYIFLLSMHARLFETARRHRAASEYQRTLRSDLSVETDTCSDEGSDCSIRDSEKAALGALDG